jgi:long-chain acyl-CoA synthetase
MISNALALVHHFLEESANSFPYKHALIHENIRATYDEINSYSNQLAYWLIDQGIEKGDMVVLILENSLEYVVSYYGILKTGAVAVPLSSELKPDGLKPLIKELESKVIVSSSRFEKVLQESNLQNFNVQALLIKEPKLEWSDDSINLFKWEDVIKKENCSNINITIEPGDLASIIYTSGSTSKPKGVMLSHSNILANTKSICQYLNLTNKDIQMVVLPFFYVMGKSLLNTHFAVGGTVVLNNKFAFPAAVIKQMDEENITGFSGVPSTYAYLLHRSPLEKYRDKLTSLRYCSQAGGHMSKKIKQELRRVLPEHTKIYIMYGATEASARLTYLDPTRFYDKIESIGKAIPDVSMKVLDENGREVAVEQVGEIVGSGANIMQGYYKDPEITAKVIDHNGYHTGDMGYRDEEGFLYLVGRRDNLLKVGGHRINTQEIEDVIMETGIVVEAVVLGVPDELLGNKLIAVVSPIDMNTTQNQILESCAKKLPRYKLPSEIKIVKSLPKYPSGKINKERCKDIIDT